MSRGRAALLWQFLVQRVVAEEDLNLMASCTYANKFTWSGDSVTQAIVVAESRQWLLLPGLIKPEQFRYVQTSVGTPDPQILDSSRILAHGSQD